MGIGKYFLASRLAGVIPTTVRVSTCLTRHPMQSSPAAGTSWRFVVKEVLESRPPGMLETQPCPSCGSVLATATAPPTINTRKDSKVWRFIERLVALAMIVALSPLFFAVAIAVRATSPGPAIYKQTRVGKGGKRFEIWKFRTMRSGADAQLRQLLEQNGTHDRPLFKVPQDPRITRVGSFLRKSSLDELPQLVNVFKGEMSFIGPRPQRPAEVALYSPRELRRLEVHQGLTGMWQVNGRSDLPWEEAVELDIQYVNERSIMLNIKILFKTFTVVFSGRGAN
ncbi:MAG: sugar transferase [Stackebrandtia sp.]